MKWLSRLARSLRRNHPIPIITNKVDADGIAQTIDGISTRIEWRNVVSVVAWKKDCLTSDQIRLIIADTQHSIECREGDAGFADCVTLQTYLPKSLPNWYLVLAASPAFAATVTTVYPIEPQ